MVMGAPSLSGIVPWWAIVAPHTVPSVGSGMMGPNSSAGAVCLCPRLAGTASSWVGLTQMGMGAIGAVAVAVTTAIGSRYIALPFVLASMPFALLTVLSFRLLRKPA